MLDSKVSSCWCKLRACRLRVLLSMQLSVWLLAARSSIISIIIFACIEGEVFKA